MEMGVFGHIDGAVERVGTMETLPAYEEQFTYAESFIASHPQSCLSLSLPLQEAPFTSRRTRPYFKNLLPEGAALDAVARQLVALTAFNVMVGNCDAHLKNLSLICDAAWSRRVLVPAYDLASTVVYEGLDRHFSMRIGSSSKVDDICRDDFGKFAEEVSMTRRAVLAIVDDVAGAVVRELPRVIEEAEDVLCRKLGKVEAIREYSIRKSRDLSTER